MNNPSKSHERHALLQAITADRKLPGNAVRLAVTLMAFVNNATGLCCPSQEKIRDRCHLSRNTIDSMARVLERQGWLRIERRERSYTRYHFMFDRIREGGDYSGFSLLHGWGHTNGTFEEETGFSGSTVEPKTPQKADGAGSTADPALAQNLKKSGSTVQQELKEVNSQSGTQESLFGEDGLPLSTPFDFETWFEQKWWPQYPSRIEKAAAKKMAKAIIEGRRSDGLKAMPFELLAGVMRYAAAVTGKDPQYVKKPTTWLSRGCWTDEHPERAERHASASTQAVWRAGEEMVARNRRAAG
jgi:Helix-turn-helix domain